MALPLTGPISFSDIYNEFCGTPTSTTTTAAPTTTTTTTAAPTTTTTTTAAPTTTTTTTTAAPTTTTTTTTAAPTTTTTTTTAAPTTTTTTIPPPTIVTFTFDNNQTSSSAIANDNPNFIWNVTGTVTTLTITPIVGGTPGSAVNVLGQGTNVNPSSEVMGTISTTTTFRLTAGNSTGSVTSDIVLTIEPAVSTTFNLLSPVESGDAIIGAFTTTVANRAYIRRQDPGPTYVNVYGSSASPITVTPGALNSGINLGTADYATMGGSVNYLLTVFLASNPSNTNTQTRTLTINAPSSVLYRFDVISSSMTENTTQNVTIVSPSSNTGPFTITVASGPGQVKPFGSGTYSSSVSVTTSVPSGEPEATGQFTLQATATGSIVLNYFNGATLVNTSTVTATAAGTTTTTTTTAAPTTTTTTTTVAPSVSLTAINNQQSIHSSPVNVSGAVNIFLYFGSNGTLYAQDGDGVTVNYTNWRTPTSTGIGSNYWIRWTLSSVDINTGAGNTYDAGSGGWLSLATNKSFGVSTGSVSQQRQITAVYNIDIASDSSGSTIVASCTHTLVAEVTSIN